MSKFQIVKGVTNNLIDTPYVEGKVYFVYTDTESEDLDIYADIDGVRRKIKEGIQEDALSNYLLKTDIAEWAKAESKPTYTYSEVGAAASSHTHGSITNAGAITSNTAFANGDRLVFSDNSDSSLLKRSSITFGTSTTQYLANNGTWQNVPTTSVSQTLTTGTEIGKVNGTSLYAPNSYDDTSLAARVTALENLEWATYYSGRQNPSDSQGNNGDIYLQY